MQYKIFEAVFCSLRGKLTSFFLSYLKILISGILKISLKVFKNLISYFLVFKKLRENLKAFFLNFLKRFFYRKYKEFSSKKSLHNLLFRLLTHVYEWPNTSLKAVFVQVRCRFILFYLSNWTLPVIEKS